MAKRSILDGDEALRIARKLDAEISEGRSHQRAIVRLEGQFVGQFGIRRGSGSLGHDYVPKQIKATTREAIDLSRCPLSKDEFVQRLQARGQLDAPEGDQGKTN